jgi:hypothetical protein
MAEESFAQRLKKEFSLLKSEIVERALEEEGYQPPLDQSVITDGNISNQIDTIYIERKRTYVKLPPTLIGRPGYVSKLSVIISVIVILTCFAIVNNFWSYGPREETRRLTPEHLLNPQSRGQLFLFKGVVTSSFRTRNDLFILSLKSEDGGKTIQVPIWPSFGELPLVRRGDTVEIDGNLGKYRGKWQLNPLSAEHIRINSAEHIRIIDEWYYSLAVPLSQALKRIDETLLIGPVDAVDAVPFTSKSGKKHLRIVVRDQEEEVSGIIYEGSWNEIDLEIFRKKQTVYLKAKVVKYNGKPSIETMSVKLR